MVNDKAIELMRKARESKGLKQDDIAQKLGVRKQTVSSWETGKNDIDIDLFVKYCKICGADYLKIMREAYSDTAEPRQTIDCTASEIELLKKYRSLDEHGQRVVRRVVNAEYEDMLATFGEDLENATGHG